MSTNQGRIDAAFTYHRPLPGDVEAIESLREDFKDVAEGIDLLCPDGREKALALTKLEEVMMWANAAIVRRHA